MTTPISNEAREAERKLVVELQSQQEFRAERIQLAICRATEALQKENEQLRKQYNELLYAVIRKFPNETRHETALRYINETEQSVLCIGHYHTGPAMNKEEK